MDLEFKQYDVVMVDLPEVESESDEQSNEQSNEQPGKQSSIQHGKRPAVIIQNNIGNKFSPTLLIIPLTGKVKSLRQPTHTLIRKDAWNGLKKDSMVLAEQTTTVDKSSVKKIGEIRNPVAQRQILACFLNEALYGLNLETIRFKGGRVCTA